MLTQNRFTTFIVLVFSELNKAQIYKMPRRDSPYHGNVEVMSFNYLNSCRPNKHIKFYYIRKSNLLNFLFEIEEKN